MLGGGTFTSMNKIIPGAYINFVSAPVDKTLLGQRGVCAAAFAFDWGEEGKLVKLTGEDFLSNAQLLFGYNARHDKMKNLREMFLHANTVYVYRLTGTGGTKASNTFAEARFSGVRGNDIKTVIEKNADSETTLYNVYTYLGTAEVDCQVVTGASQLKDNDYVTFKTSASLTETAGTAMTGGVNPAVNGASHKSFLDILEGYTGINCITTGSTDGEIKGVYAAFVRRMREGRGVKLQAVLYDYAGDYEGVINAATDVLDDGAEESSLVYWTCGAAAGCSEGSSLTNMLYDGEYTPDADYSQAELENAVENGQFVFHNVNGEPRVLLDINSLIGFSDKKGDIFADNQTVRTNDAVASGIGKVFAEKFMGKVPNNDDGRIELWSDVVKLLEELQAKGAIESFSPEDVTVSKGEGKNSVVIEVKITVSGMMTTLYMTVIVG